MVKNPRAKLVAILKTTAVDMQAAEDAVLAYCDAHADQQYLDDKAVRAVHPLLADDRIWNVIRDELGL